MKKIFFYGLFWAISVAAAGQTEMDGLILDAAAYEKVPQLADFEFFGSKYGEISSEYSLKGYCPEPNRQKEIHNCVFQTLSYAMMTILYAAQNNITDKAEINKIKFSALYGFNQLTNATCSPIPVVPALNFLRDKGNLSFADFDAPNPTDCHKKATVEQHRKATHYKIKNYTRLFDNKDDVNKKIRAIKKSIAANIPILAAMHFPESIKTYYGQSEYYSGKGAAEVAHAMTLVGYDEYSFEFLNSWGTEWGSKGYIKIKYNDFFNYLREAYQIAFEKQIVREEIALKGHFEFKTPREGAMQGMSFILKEGKYYQSVEKCAVGQQFQLSALDLQKNKYVYVFSYDPDGKTSLHWPKIGGTNPAAQQRESPLTPYETTSFIMPAPKRAFTKDKAGTDYLFVLYSDKELNISDLEMRLKQMETATGLQPLSKFETAFQGLLLDWKKIKYDAQKVTFSAPMTNAIVPLILQLEGL